MKKAEINVLIVDDDKSMREVLSELVKRAGYRPIAVAKPEEAESLVKIKPIHALILDVMLPGKNGVDLAMKLRENVMENAGIIFVSGIYKDRAFAQEAILRVGAIEYLTKPFSNDVLIKLLSSKLEEYSTAPKTQMSALVSSVYSSDKERRRALDYAEEMTGFDLPFVYCILMDSESSGYLNIVDEDQNIYGVTFCKGALVKVDSEATSQLTRNILVKHGFISDADISELTAKGSEKRDIVRSLVEEGLMSPHAPEMVKRETSLLSSLVIINEKKLNINFVPDRKLQHESDNISMKDFVGTLHDMIDNVLTLEWLRNFYSQWQGHPIKCGPEYFKSEALTYLPLLQKVPGLVEHLRNEATIEELRAHFPQFTEEALYKAIHFLMLRRALIFEETKRSGGVDEHINRLRGIHDSLKNKNPFEIFAYFGLSMNPKASEVVRVYKEFAKSHHPDTLPRGVSKEVKELNHELFSRVTSAYEILSDERKKEKFLNEVKQVEAERQLKSDDLITAAAKDLTHGKYPEALNNLQKAVDLYKSDRALLHLWWAQFKNPDIMNNEQAKEIESGLRNMSPGARKTVLWPFVHALLKRYLGDFAGAEAELHRAIQTDERFTDARRELAVLKNMMPKKLTAEEILKGDLSTVVKGLFKKKVG